MIKDINIYFEKGCGRCKRFDTEDCSVHLWDDGLAELRRICLAVGLTETVKWENPCYTHKNRNIANFGAFRANFRISFLNASLLKDPKKILEKPGPNTRVAHVVSFTDVASVLKLEPTIVAYLKEAMAYAEKGVKPKAVVRKAITAESLPDELSQALEADQKYKDAFFQLTPGRQRSYIMHVEAAKKSETKVSRIKKFRAKVLTGKGLTDL